MTKTAAPSEFEISDSGIRHRPTDERFVPHPGKPADGLWRDGHAKAADDYDQDEVRRMGRIADCLASAGGTGRSIRARDGLGCQKQTRQLCPFMTRILRRCSVEICQCGISRRDQIAYSIPAVILSLTLEVNREVPLRPDAKQIMSHYGHCLQSGHQCDPVPRHIARTVKGNGVGAVNVRLLHRRVDPANFGRHRMKRMGKPAQRCAFCHGRLGLLVSRHWDLRFCSRSHKEAYLRQQELRLDNIKRWLSYLRPTVPTK